MFSVCTRHQPEQNGFLSLPGPISVFFFHPHQRCRPFFFFFNAVCAHKEMTMPPIYRRKSQGCSHTYIHTWMLVCMCEQEVSRCGWDGAGVLCVNGYVESSVSTNIRLCLSVMSVWLIFSHQAGSTVHLVPIRIWAAPERLCGLCQCR